jgi:hypothetical protein
MSLILEEGYIADNFLIWRNSVCLLALESLILSFLPNWTTKKTGSYFLKLAAGTLQHSVQFPKEKLRLSL